VFCVDGENFEIAKIKSAIQTYVRNRDIQRQRNVIVLQ